MSMLTLNLLDKLHEAKLQIKREDEERRARDASTIKVHRCRPIEFLKGQFMTKMKNSVKLNDLLEAQKTTGFQGCMG